MSDINCSACDELRSEAPTFALNGTTTAVCNSLKNNTGLATNNGHDNETDLADAVDCLIGRMDDELEAYDVCDWKEFMHKYIPNNYDMLKAMLCGDAGQWNNIKEMWCWLQNLATTPKNYSLHAYEDDDPTKPAVNGFRIVDGVEMQMPGPGIAPITVRTLGNTAFISGSLYFSGNMPSDYTNGATVSWGYLKQGCSALTTVGGETWGADGSTGNAPLIWEIQFKACQLGFSRMFGPWRLGPTNGGDFEFRVVLYAKGATVPPDYSANVGPGGTYYPGYYTFNPADDDMLLLQVRLVHTRTSLYRCTPNGTGIVVACPDSWSC